MVRDVLIALSQSRRLSRLATSSSLAQSAARRFVAGQTVDQAVEHVKALNGGGLLATLDRLGENVTTVRDALAGTAASLEVLDRIRASGVQSTLSVKLTSLGLDMGDRLATDLVDRIAAHAATGGEPIEVTIDMEGSAYTQRTLDLFHAVHRRQPHLAAVVQSMLYRTEKDVEALIEAGASVRVVKGAYLEPPSVAYPAKRDSDNAYLRIVERFLSAEARATGAYVAVATHDEAIIAWTKLHAEERGVPKDAFEFQMLFGVRRDLQARLAADGYRVRVYVPFGTHWFPYTMRRLAERPENVGFLVRGVLAEMRSR
jgi:proline dehydrogenase